MLLLSNFKDYYDYMIGITGVDEKIVYNRSNITDKFLDNQNFYNFPRCSSTNHYHEYLILSICGKRYTLICDKKDNRDIKYINYNFLKCSDLRLVTMKDLEDSCIYYDVTTFWDRHRSKRSIKNTYNELHGKIDSDLIEISKKIKIPVFLISSVGCNHTNIHSRTPILSQIGGIPGMIPPDKLFNDICYFISNIINNDKKMIEISNKDKILKAGFDLKTSFRKVKEKCQK